jgi:hypothetical protein
MSDVAEAFEKQADWCDRLDSPFTAALLRHLARGDLMRGGPLAARLTGWEGDPTAAALPLRVAGALHHLARSGLDAALAAAYPPHVTLPQATTLAALPGAIAGHDAVWAVYLAGAPQTNEVRRSLGMLPAFLTAAAAFPGKPLDLFEIGASAGLNLGWDRYGYSGPGWQWGDAASPLQISCNWQGGPPPLVPVRVARRQGCDLAPIDLRDPAARQRLLSYVWADQAERLARVEAAVGLALLSPPELSAGDAADWLAQALPHRLPGHLAILWHSVVWQYLPETTKQRVADITVAAAAAATVESPFAYVRFEPDGAGGFAVTLDLWPGPVGGRRLIAQADPHGRWVTLAG